MRAHLAAAATILATVAISAQPGAVNNTLTAVPGIAVGHYTLPERPTGCTVIVIEGGAMAGVDVRGGAPATSETDLLSPEKMVQAIYGIALSGGSTFGLESRGGVLKYLEEKKIGIAYGGMRIPIVPAASIFDLPVGDSRIRPGADCGYRAAMAATTSPVQEGSVGAGAGATLGKYLGMTRAMKGGVGSAAMTTADGTIIAALVVANPMGDIVDPATGKIVAGVRKAQGGGFEDVRTLMRTGSQRPSGGGNTTLGVIATNATLNKAQALRLAQLAGDGFVRAIWPIHTNADGDTVFALATGSKQGEPDMIALGALAADVMASAVIRAATQATSLPNLPAVRDLR
jgi:L-aminopeptidase/D-esterase-like protein